MDKIAIPTSQRTVLVKKISRYCCREVVAVYCDSNTKRINTFIGKNAKLILQYVVDVVTTGIEKKNVNVHHKIIQQTLGVKTQLYYYIYI